jgi:mercuric transport protein
VNTNIEERKGTGPRWRLIGAVVSAVGASVCCVGPLLLLALGIGGAWVGNLTAMEKYRPFWTAATLIFLGLAFLKVYRKPKNEPYFPGDDCRPETGRRNRILLWVVAVFVLGLLFLPYILPYAFAGETGGSAAISQVTLSVRNITCAACSVTVKKGLTRVDGVKDAKVTSIPPQAMVTYDPAKVRVEQLVEATTKAGFPSTFRMSKRPRTYASSDRRRSA